MNARTSRCTESRASACGISPGVSTETPRRSVVSCVARLVTLRTYDPAGPRIWPVSASLMPTGNALVTDPGSSRRTLPAPRGPGTIEAQAQSRADRSPFARGLPEYSGDAGVARNDLSGPVRPGTRRTQTGVGHASADRSQVAQAAS